MAAEGMDLVVGNGKAWKDKICLLVFDSYGNFLLPLLWFSLSIPWVIIVNLVD